MKCPICSAENPPDANSCHQCGFSLSLGRSMGIDFPTIEVPEPAALPQWPELPGYEAPPAPPQPVWPEDDTPATTVTELGEKEEPAVEIVAAETPPPAQPSDDELARLHIARGFEATREKLLDQARWEFEQARHLADDPHIVHMAQSQLDELSRAPTEAAPEPVRPIKKLSLPPISDLTGPTDWKPTIRTGLILGALNGALTGCGAACCLGFLLAPACGFAAGWLAARQVGNTHREGQPPNAIHAIVAGVITGLGGWLGEVIGHPIWLASSGNGQTNAVATTLFVACVPGVLYILLAVAASALGWNKGTAKQ